MVSAGGDLRDVLALEDQPRRARVALDAVPELTVLAAAPRVHVAGCCTRYTTSAAITAQTTCSQAVTGEREVVAETARNLADGLGHVDLDGLQQEVLLAVGGEVLAKAADVHVAVLQHERRVHGPRRDRRHLAQRRHDLGHQAVAVVAQPRLPVLATAPRQRLAVACKPTNRVSARTASTPQHEQHSTSHNSAYG